MSTKLDISIQGFETTHLMAVNFKTLCAFSARESLGVPPDLLGRANVTFTETLNSVLRDVMAKLWAMNLAIGESQNTNQYNAPCIYDVFSPFTPSQHERPVIFTAEHQLTAKHKPMANRKRQKNRTVRGYWAKS